MASNTQLALEIQARMAALREHMGVSVDQAAVSARRWSDWRYYVRRFPLTTTVLAAGVGYLVVPRRYRIVVPDDRTVAKLAQRGQLAAPQRPAVVDSQSLARKVLGIVAAAAGRAALSYIGGRLASGSANGIRQARSEQRQQHNSPAQPSARQAPRRPR